MFTPGARGVKGAPASGRRSSTATPSSTPRARDGLQSKRILSQSFSRRSLHETTGLDKTSDVGHILSEYGAPVPVSVTEALTLTERGQKVSVNLDRTGWAWLVCGRKLIVWNYRKAKSAAGSCYDLQLPHTSSSSHHATLVRVFELNGCTACMAVTRDGTVWFWKNVSHEGGLVETRADIGGDYCSSLVSLQSGICVIGTSQCSLYAVISGAGMAGLTCRPLKISQGALGFFGKFLPWQSSTSGDAAPTLRRLLAGEMLVDGSQAVYVLKSDGLQKWSVAHNSHKVLYQFDVASVFRDNIAQVAWNRLPNQLTGLTTELQDMEPINDGVMILGAGVNTNTSNDVKYALGTLHTEGDLPPQSFLSFSLVNHTNLYDNETRILPAYSLLLTQPLPKYIYLYNEQTIVSIADGRPDQLPEVVEFDNLGGGSHECLAVFLSSRGYLVCIQDKPPALDTSVADSLMKTTSFAVLDTSIVSSAKKSRLTPGNSADDRIIRLKAAFLASIQDSLPESQALVDELFPPGSTTQRDAGSSLDVLVTDLSQEMIDDYPASDPRWGDALPKDAGASTASLILLHQLDDKLKAHELYLRFLKNSGLWERMCTIQLRGSILQAVQVLCEHAEKIEAAKALRELHNEHERLINAAIEEVVRTRGTVSPSPALTSQDLFYREVSRIDDFIVCLIDYEDHLLNSNISTSETLYVISAVNTICLYMLTRAHEYRRNQTALYQCGSRKRNPQEDFLTWTSSNSRPNLRSALRRQHVFTVERGLPDCDDAQMKSLYFQQLLELSDLLLDGYREQLEGVRSVKGESRRYTELQQVYEKERATLIEPFLKHRQYERATALSEKFCHFAALVRLCEEVKNEDRLNQYMEQFKDEGFSDFVFKWYMDAGKRGKLMTSHLASSPLLARFLQTKDNQFLSWLHDINCGSYNQAQTTLQSLAQQEENYLGRKKTLLSLSKLSAVAADEMSDSVRESLECMNNDLMLIMHQEQLFLNEDINERVGVEGDRLKVLNAVELIDLLIDEYNPNANEVDFKKALDLTQFIDQNMSGVNMNDILLRIWSKAVLKDRWNRVSTTDPVDICRDTVFYKLINLAMAEEMDMTQYLPSVDQLLESELLEDLSSKPDFIYLMRGLYEHLSRVKQSV